MKYEIFTIQDGGYIMTEFGVFSKLTFSLQDRIQRPRKFSENRFLHISNQRNKMYLKELRRG